MCKANLRTRHSEFSESLKSSVESARGRLDVDRPAVDTVPSPQPILTHREQEGEGMRDILLDSWNFNILGKED